MAPRWRGGRLSCDGPVALVGAGPLAPEVLGRCLALSVGAMAADGGARALIAAGRMPDAVIGDLDSFDVGTVPAERVLHLRGQDDTDLEKCLARIDAPLVLGAGFLGGRVDHELAAINVLARLATRAVPPCVLLGAEDAVFAIPARMSLALPPGTRVSLFPLAPVRGRSAGLRWPIDGVDFAPDGRVGTSNRVADGAAGVLLEMGGPGMIGIVPAASFGAVVAAFLG